MKFKSLPSLACNSARKPSKSPQWTLRDLNVSSGHLLLFVVIITLLLGFLYFDILHFTPSGGILLQLPSLSSTRHFMLLAKRFRSPGSLTQDPSSPHHLQSYHLGSSKENVVEDPYVHPSDISNTSSPVVVSSPSGTSTRNELIPQSVPISHSDADVFVRSPPTSIPLLDLHSFTGPTTPNVDPPLEARDVSPPPSLLHTLQNQSDVASEETYQMEAQKQREKVIEEEEEEMYFKRPKMEDGQCNLFEGKWVRDDSYPIYRAEDCPFIDTAFRCQENGRPNQDYAKWRWQPSGCDMPRFNSEDMLNFLRGRRLVFVGDSIGRNQWESLLCMLAAGVRNKTRIFEVNGQPITNHKGFLIFRFESYNCTIEYYRSPFLVPQGSPPHDSPKSVQCTLKVDTIDWASKRWLGADAIVFNTGHWWSYEKTLKLGCYFQVGEHVEKNISVRDGLAIAMQTWKKWVAFNIDPSKTSAFFRTYAPVHFSGGTWKTGGRCNMEIEPYKEGIKFGREPWSNGVALKEVTTMMPSVRLLDITHLSNFRKDAHPSIYYRLPTEDRPMDHQDCSHWCLPGLPDTWNQLLYASLLQSAPWLPLPSV